VQPVSVGDVRPGVPVEHHDVDALSTERVREGQPADAGADYPYPQAHDVDYGAALSRGK
jgi:hypothetical protein